MCSATSPGYARMTGALNLFVSYAVTKDCKSGHALPYVHLLVVLRAFQHVPIISHFFYGCVERKIVL